jgi:hypothetical protein
MDGLRNLARNKIKGSSLLETLIASVLIMIVFGISMVTVGNVLERTVKSNTRSIDNDLNKLEYLYQNGQIETPDVIENGDWRIQIEKGREGDLVYVFLRAQNKKTLKEEERKILE